MLPKIHTLAGLLFGVSLAISYAQADAVVGINDHILYRTSAELDTTFDVYDDSDTRFVRINVDWNTLEPSDDVYSGTRLATLDDFFQRCATENVRILASVAYAPSWVNGGNAGAGWPPLDYVKYADFLEWFLRRYADYQTASGERVLDAIELWNEPDLCDLFFKGYPRNSPAAATIYGNMVKVAGGRLLSVRNSLGAQDVLIGAPVIANPHDAAWSASGSDSWIDAFYAVPDVTDYYDFFSWHSYWEHCGSTGWLPPELPACWYPADQKQAVLGRLTASNEPIWAKIMANGDHLKPNWCTELGGLARSSTADHSQRLLSFAEQNTHLQDALEVLSAGHVTNLERIYWYELFDEPGNIYVQQAYGIVALNNSNPITYSGNIALDTATLTAKTAYSTYANADKGDGGSSSGVFIDDFNDGNDHGWVVTPSTWSVANNAYVNVHNANTAISHTGDSSWTDYDAFANISFSNAWKSAGLVARHSSGSTGYYLRLAVNGSVYSHNLSVLRGSTVVATTSISNLYNCANFRQLKLSVRDEAGGVRVRGYVDGNLHIDYLDTASVYTSGGIAVRAEPWSGTVTMDYIVVNPD
ncbi:hypothetical protein [Cerasicoccus frondis]|uniref:hypothetical protein n=1 Tax=Cerasicoccus frondis TaxID=490090 RepID=UPI00285260C3|nr:hypothetical protein [Cerasicoccus frondis]